MPGTERVVPNPVSSRSTPGSPYAGQLLRLRVLRSLRVGSWGWGLALVALPFLPSCRPEGSVVPPLPESAVSGERALALATELVGIGPRPSGSGGARATAQFLAGVCRDAGLQSEVDEWEEDTRAGVSVCSITLSSSRSERLEP